MNKCSKQRPIPPHRAALQPGRLGRLQLLRLLTATPAGLPITWALADPKIDERDVLTAVLDHDPFLTTARPGLTDKGCVSRELDTYLAERGVTLLRPSHRNRVRHPGEHLLSPARQPVESIFDTLGGSSRAPAARH